MDFQVPFQVILSDPVSIDVQCQFQRGLRGSKWIPLVCLRKTAALASPWNSKSMRSVQIRSRTCWDSAGRVCFHGQSPVSSTDRILNFQLFPSNWDASQISKKFQWVPSIRKTWPTDILPSVRATVILLARIVRDAAGHSSNILSRRA